MESPSIFGSPMKGRGSVSANPRKRRTRAANSKKPSAENTLSSDSIGTRCRTLPNAPAGAAPTRADGLSARTSAGNRASIAALRCLSASYSASETSGASSA